MLKHTLVWVLRFAPMELVIGLITFIYGIWMVFNLPADDPNVAYVSVLAMFGIWPYVILALFGVCLLIYAWRKGANWKNGR